MTENNEMGPIVGIVVRGDIGAGKSTICQLIEKALKEEGINNGTVTGEEENQPWFYKSYSRRVESLKDKNVKIKIRVEQMSRLGVKGIHESGKL